jgi:hypothetical protein
MPWKLNPSTPPAREDEPIRALPAEPEEIPRSLYSTWGVFDLLLKAPERMGPYLRLPELQAGLNFHFAVIAFLGLGAHALVLAGVILSQPGSLPAWLHPDGTKLAWWRLTLGFLAAFPLGVLLATLLVLPAYWYLARLSRMRMSFQETLCHSLKGKATSSILLLGLLPIYGVLVACVILARLGDASVQLLFYLGLLLPFLCGLRGAGAIAEGFTTVADTTSGLSRASRAALPSSLMVAWALLFTVVTPVVLIKAFQTVVNW